MTNMGDAFQWPSPGSIVEFIEDGQVQIAFILDESGGKLRLMLQNRREMRLGANRVLPWIGPVFSPATGKEDVVKLLEKHNSARLAQVSKIDCEEVWSISSGEVNQAPASWFAELFENNPDIDNVAAYGRALLAAKDFFRFLNPEFLIFDEETAKRRMAEKEARELKEKLAGEGSAFLQKLWDISTKKRDAAELESLRLSLADSTLAEKLENILFERMVNPDSTKDDDLWHRLTRSLPDNPFLPVQLLEAWGKIPPHHNFWLDRAEFNAKENWWHKDMEDVDRLADHPEKSGQNNLPVCAYPFVSIDGESTTDIDDAFFLEKTADGWHLVMAFANPALYWPFDSNLDKKVSRRATSLYLPEGTLHMLPPVLGENTFSLLQNQERPALCLDISLDGNGHVIEASPFIASVTLKANLHYSSVQQLLDNPQTLDNDALEFLPMLSQAKELGALLEKNRIEQGAIIMERPEPQIMLEGEGEDISVTLVPEESLPDAKKIVSEMMILASFLLADWAWKNKIPLIYRTQKITVPKEYAGIWSQPADLARISKVLMPSLLETEPGFHAALGMPRYAPVTSPLRRYADLVNEAQINSFLLTGKPRLEAEPLKSLLSQFSLDLENSVHVQKYRPRYWKLLYFKQQGDKKWWPAVITDENEFAYMLTLPEQGLFLKGKRQLFEERAMPGMKVNVRVGKINPLYNEIQVLEAIADEIE